jgi:hypothetical protein
MGKRKSDRHRNFFGYRPMPGGAARRLEIIQQQEAEVRRRREAENPKPKRARPVSVRPVQTRSNPSDSFGRPHFNELGWFGDGDNGHWHLDGLMSSKSYYSIDLFLDALKEQGFEHVTLFELTVDFETTGEFMENISLRMCNYSIQFWTSFVLHEGTGRDTRTFFGIATMTASEMMFLMLAAPSEFTANRVNLDDLIS